MIPNRHNVIFTGLNRHTMQPCNVQDPHRWFDSIEAATGFAAESLARAANYLDDGTALIDGRTVYWQFKPVSFRIHSYYQDPTPPQFAPPPLSGTEWDRAWREGPGGEP
jgi:hypothetical protein